MNEGMGLRGMGSNGGGGMRVGDGDMAQCGTANPGLPGSG